MFAKKVPHEDFSHFQFKIEIEEGIYNTYPYASFIYALPNRKKDERVREDQSQV